MSGSTASLPRLTARHAEGFLRLFETHAHLPSQPGRRGIRNESSTTVILMITQLRFFAEDLRTALILADR